MKKRILIHLYGVIALLFAASIAGSAYSASDEDSKLARYGQYGGPYSLVDHHGKSVTDEDYLGQYVLIFFGYTYCPDVCPTSMQVIGDALDDLVETGQRIQPIFVSVDPDRDTPEELASYVSQFHPRMIGLTGTKEQILKAADDYGATYFKVYHGPSTSDEDDSENGGKGSYLISHSAAIYLMDPDGKFITLFTFGTSSEEIVRKIRNIIGSSAQ